MQYEQKRLHPSSIFTNARVRPVKFSTLRSSNFSSFVCGAMSMMRWRAERNASRSGTRRLRFEVPRIISASSSRLASSGNACAMQPVSTITASGLSFFARRKICRTLRSLSAVTVQELRITTSAVSLSSAAAKPCCKREESIASDSYWFTLQPRVMTFAFIIYFNFLSSHVVFFQPKRQLRPVVH